MPVNDHSLLTASRLRCPTCRAEQDFTDECRRCKSDLSLVHHAARLWRQSRTQCLMHLRSGRYQDAVSAAHRHHAIAPDDHSARLLSVCLLRSGRFDAALALAAKVGAEGEPPAVEPPPPPGRAGEPKRLQLKIAELAEAEDEHRQQGRHEEAAYAAWQIAQAHLRRGELLHELAPETKSPAQSNADAATARLDAAEAFLRASDERRAGEALTAFRAQAQEQEEVPSALRDRAKKLDKQTAQLKQQTTDAFVSLSSGGRSLQTPSQDTLDLLLDLADTLPGWAMRHFLIYRQAVGLGQADLARHHIQWASDFDPDTGRFVAALGYLLCDAGDFDEAVERGEAFLQRRPERAPGTRLMMAYALAYPGDQRETDLARAIEVVEPMRNLAQKEPRQSGVALTLQTSFHQELGQADLADRAAADLNELAQSNEDPEFQEFITSLRSHLPQQPANFVAGEDAAPAADEQGRKRLLEFSRRISH